MCRFALYLGTPIRVRSLVTDPDHSIVMQSVHAREREEPLNGDGFGIGWYAPTISEEPAIFKDVSPAWSNPNLAHLARITETPCLLAHVRAATPGLPVTHLNCHPFSWGRFAFMHNGDIPEFRRLVRPLRARLSDAAYQRVLGSTDSEHVFALFSDHYERDEGEGVERTARALSAAIGDVAALLQEHDVQRPAFLNLAVTDGTTAVVSRYVSNSSGTANSLYVHAGRQYVCEDGVCRMIDADKSKCAVIVASEPLSADEGWDRVPENHLVVVHADQRVELRPIG